MADLKISQLTGATTPLAGTEVLPIVQSGSTKQVSVANLTAGRSISTAGASLDGAVTINESGADVDFRVEGDTDSNLIFADASTNQVGFGTAAPDAKCSVVGISGVPQARFGTSGNAVYFNAFDNNPMYMTTSATNSTAFGLGTASNIPLLLIANNVTHATVAPGGDVTLNTGNIVQGVAAKGVTTGGSFSLGLGTNGSTSQGTLDTSGNLTIIGYVKGATQSLSGQQSLTGSATINAATYLVTMYGLSGTATLTLPASPTIGQIIRIRSQSNEAVISASNNITSLASGAVTNAILSATAGKWADLWWDGSYWNIIAAN